MRIFVASFAVYVDNRINLQHTMLKTMHRNIAPPHTITEKNAIIIRPNRTDRVVRIWHTDCLLRRK